MAGKKRLLLLAGTVLIFLLAGCSHVEHIERKLGMTSGPKAKVVRPEEGKKKPAQKGKEGEVLPEKPGKGRAEAPAVTQKKGLPPEVGRRAPRKKVSRGKSYSVAFNFDDADIYEVIRVMLGEVLKINYVVDPTVRGKVTIHTEGALTEGDLYHLVETILQLNGLALVKKGGLYAVVPMSKLPALGKMGPPSAKFSRIDIIPLHFTSAQGLASVLRHLTSPGATLLVEPYTNTLIVSDTPENIEKIKSIVRIVDTDLFSGIKFKLVPLRFMDCTEMASILDKALAGLPTSKGLGARWIPIKSTNSLLLLGRTQAALDSMGQWIEALDTGGEEQGSNVYIYPVENGNAEDIANLLKELYGGRPSGSSAKRKTLVKAKKVVYQGGVASGETGGEVKIIPDKVNNMIIIKATPKDYKVIESVIKKIDIVPRQVLIEVLIAEVSLNKNIEFGVEWYIKTRGARINGTSYTGVITQGTGRVVPYTGGLETTTPSGLTYAVYNNSRDLRALITALSEISSINILSSPAILATDNQEAKIDVGREVPTLSSSVVNTSAQNPNITYTVEYRNSGILLTVKPHINSSGLVSLDISQEVSQAEPNTTSGIDSPIFLKRTAQTHVVVRDGQTIIFGGLIQENKALSKTGIPYLMDIPVIGSLFGRTRWEKKRTELLIAITPHVVRNETEAQAMTEEFKSRIKELKKLLREGKATLPKGAQNLGEE